MKKLITITIIMIWVVPVLADSLVSGDSSVSGHVYYMNEPVKGAKIKVGYISENPVYIGSAEAYTDNEGYYYINISADALCLGNIMCQLSNGSYFAPDYRIAEYGNYGKHWTVDFYIHDIYDETGEYIIGWPVCDIKVNVE